MKTIVPMFALAASVYLGAEPASSPKTDQTAKIGEAAEPTIPQAGNEAADDDSDQVRQPHVKALATGQKTFQFGQSRFAFNDDNDGGEVNLTFTDNNGGPSVNLD